MQPLHRCAQSNAVPAHKRHPSSPPYTHVTTNTTPSQALQAGLVNHMFRKESRLKGLRMRRLSQDSSASSNAGSGSEGSSDASSDASVCDWFEQEEEEVVATAQPPTTSKSQQLMDEMVKFAQKHKSWEHLITLKVVFDRGTIVLVQHIFVGWQGHTCVLTLLPWLPTTPPAAGLSEAAQLKFLSALKPEHFHPGARIVKEVPTDTHTLAP